MYNLFIKTSLDVLFSTLLLILLSPILIITAFLVLFINGTPILFKQDRPGYNEKIFTIYKFRTMNNKTDAKGVLLPDKERTTRLGKFLRITSLDELPELINILKGDMSFVGPRPLLVKYLPLYNDTQKLRHSVKPGLTGLAQINGRNNTTWDKRFEYDVFYAQNITFLLDFKIVFLTIFKILSKNDNMEEFIM